MSTKSTVCIVSLVMFVVGGALVTTPAEAGPPAPVAGAYIADLDLGGLGAPRIEQLYVILGAHGSVLFTSEHEADKESAGIGSWKRLTRGRIGLGAASFRYGPDAETSICGTVGVESPPGNCVLKVGGTIRRVGHGAWAGELFLTVETLDGTTTFAFPGDPPLPISMRRLALEDFPGAQP